MQHRHYLLHDNDALPSLLSCTCSRSIVEGRILLEPSLLQKGPAKKMFTVQIRYDLTCASTCHNNHSFRQIPILWNRSYITLQHIPPSALIPTLPHDPNMGKCYCDYCDVFLTNDSVAVRKQHNEGNRHKYNVCEYYRQHIANKLQEQIDQIVLSFEHRVAHGFIRPTYALPVAPKPIVFQHPIALSQPSAPDVSVAPKQPATVSATGPQAASAPRDVALGSINIVQRATVGDNDDDDINVIVKTAPPQMDDVQTAGS